MSDLHENLATRLSTAVLATSGVMQLYPPARAVPLVATVQTVLANISPSLGKAEVLVTDDSVTASVGITSTEPAADIIRRIYKTLEMELEALLPGSMMTIKVTIARVQD